MSICLCITLTLNVYDIVKELSYTGMYPKGLALEVLKPTTEHIGCFWTEKWRAWNGPNMGDTAVGLVLLPSSSVGCPSKTRHCPYVPYLCPQVISHFLGVSHQVCRKIRKKHISFAWTRSLSRLATVGADKIVARQRWGWISIMIDNLLWG